MRTTVDALSSDLVKVIKNPDALQGEDILIEDQSGEVIGIIIQPKMYKFLLKKIAEYEDEIDGGLTEEFDKNSKSLDDLLEE